MNRLSSKQVCLGLAVLAGLLSSPAGAAQITYEMVMVGNPGNAGDTRAGVNTFGKGSVAYKYQIGNYDVTIGQYTAFLNAVDPSGTNPNGIYNSSMGTNLNIAGISYDEAAAPGSKYSAIGPFGAIQIPQATAANRPITFVSWFNAARFANWMTNGQGGPGTTETGAYTLNNATSGVAPAKTPGAAFYIPNEDEWYKAAFYSPNYGGVGVPGYYAYATQSDSAPGNIIGGGANQANWITGSGFSVTQLPTLDSSQNYLTDAGAYTNSASYYGTFDQSGNVNQWNDLDGLPGSFRGLRGGDWFLNPHAGFLSSSDSFLAAPSSALNSFGFRLASPVPEIDPNGLSSVLGLIVGGLGLLERRRYGR
jgi:formylglycine-generating enzyme required for sulfatase activity